MAAVGNYVFAIPIYNIHSAYWGLKFVVNVMYWMLAYWEKRVKKQVKKFKKSLDDKKKALPLHPQSEKQRCLEGCGEGS